MHNYYDKDTGACVIFNQPLRCLQIIALTFLFGQQLVIYGK